MNSPLSRPLRRPSLRRSRRRPKRNRNLSILRRVCSRSPRRRPTPMRSNRLRSMMPRLPRQSGPKLRSTPPRPPRRKTSSISVNYSTHRWKNRLPRQPRPNRLGRRTNSICRRKNPRSTRNLGPLRPHRTRFPPRSKPISPLFSTTPRLRNRPPLQSRRRSNRSPQPKRRKSMTTSRFQDCSTMLPRRNRYLLP